MLCAVNFVPRVCPACGEPAPKWHDGLKMQGADFKAGFIAKCSECETLIMFIDGAKLAHFCADSVVSIQDLLAAKLRNLGL